MMANHAAEGRQNDSRRREDRGRRIEVDLVKTVVGAGRAAGLSVSPLIYWHFHHNHLLVLLRTSAVPVVGVQT